MDNNCNFKKTTENINNTKPDFIYEILGRDSELLASIIIEAKSESHIGKSKKKKNSDHFKKLDKDQKNYNADYSLLISELEMNDDFLIRKIHEYKNMYVIRKEYFVPFLHLIKDLVTNNKNLQRFYKDIKFKEKNEINNEFDKLKDEIINNIITKKLTNSVKSIKKNSEKITTSNDKIYNLIQEIEEKTLTKITNKINKFTIRKIMKKINN